MVRTTPLRSGIGLGLSLLMTCAAYATTPAGPLQRFHRDVRLLLTHQKRVTAKTHRDPPPLDLVPGSGDERVELDENGAIVVGTGASPRVAQPEDLTRLGLAGAAPLGNALAGLLVLTAKVKGDPAQPHVVDQARRALARQIHEADALHAWLLHPTRDATTLQLLMDRRAPTQPGRAEPINTHLTLAGTPTESLSLVGNFGWQGSRHDGSYEGVFHGQAKIVSRTPSGASRDATLADVYRFGIKTRASLTLRLRSAIRSGPAPDAFAQRAARASLLELETSDDPDLDLLHRYSKSAGMLNLRLHGDQYVALSVSGIRARDVAHQRLLAS